MIDFCEYRSINPSLYLPVIMGVWKQHELWDGTYTFKDWADAVEMIEVKQENEMRYHKYMEGVRKDGG